MAKILTGPLAASLSGRLGPVQFRQTRFGQVVQSHPRTVVHTTAAALESKSTFKTAMTMFSGLWDYHRNGLRFYALELSTTATGIFLPPVMAALRGTPTVCAFPGKYVVTPTDIALSDTGTHWRLSCGLTFPPHQYIDYPYGVAIRMDGTYQLAGEWSASTPYFQVLKSKIEPPFLWFLMQMYPVWPPPRPPWSPYKRRGFTVYPQL